MGKKVVVLEEYDAEYSRLFGKKVTNLSSDYAITNYPDIVKRKGADPHYWLVYYKPDPRKLALLHYIDIDKCVWNNTFVDSKEGKIIRDYLPHKYNIKTRSASETEKCVLLAKKLIEESQEVYEAVFDYSYQCKDRKTAYRCIIEELGDLREVYLKLIKKLSINDEEIETIRKAKKELNGGFDDCAIGIFDEE